MTLQYILPTLRTHTNTTSTKNPRTPPQYNFHQHLYQTSLTPIISPRIPQPHHTPHASLHQHLSNIPHHIPQASLIPTTSHKHHSTQHLYQTSLTPTTYPLHPPSITPPTPINPTTTPSHPPSITHLHHIPQASLHQHLYQTSLTPTTSPQAPLIPFTSPTHHSTNTYIIHPSPLPH
ncbi:hypothetical protein Pcinc_024380, partial [Petrolisthes cinctipes]